jgi:hypothetical protein
MISKHNGLCIIISLQRQVKVPSLLLQSNGNDKSKTLPSNEITILCPAHSTRTLQAA